MESYIINHKILNILRSALKEKALERNAEMNDIFVHNKKESRTGSLNRLTNCQFEIWIANSDPIFQTLIILLILLL